MRNLSLVTLISFALFAAQSQLALSQSFGDGFSGQIMGVEQQPILVLNQERLLRGSKVGQALLAKESAKKTAHQDEGLRLDAELEAEELELTKKREETDVDAFNALAIAFDEKVVSVRREHQEKSEALAGELDALRKEFFSDIVPIVAQIMKERGASMVFEQRNVLFTGQDVDITTDVIERLDSNSGLQ